MRSGMTQMQSDIMLMVSAVNLAFCLALVHVCSQHFALQKSIFVGRLISTRFHYVQCFLEHIVRYALEVTHIKGRFYLYVQY